MGQPFRVNSYQNNWQREPVILPQIDGGYLIAWESYLNDYDEGPAATYIAGQYYSPDGDRVRGEVVLTGSDMTASSQPNLTPLMDGGFVMTWIYDDYDDILTMDTEVWAAVYEFTGAIRVAPFRVDTVPSNNAVRPSVVSTGDGGFLISYGIDSSETNFDQIYARAYTALGATKGPDQLINTEVQDFDQIVNRSAALPDGRSVIIWKSEATIDNSGAGQSDIRATILASNGSVLRGDFQLQPSRGSAGTPYNFGYDVVGLPGGNFAMVHQRWAFDYFGNNDVEGTVIVIGLYDRNGAPMTNREILIHQTDEVLGDVRIARLVTGEMVVVWDQGSETPGEIGSDAYGRMLNANGQPMGAIFEIGTDIDAYTDQQHVEVEALRGGGFVVAYTDEGIDNDDDGIAASVYGRGTVDADVITVDLTGTMAGLRGDDVIRGDYRANHIDGGLGQDRLIDLAGGNDTLNGGDGNDTLQGGAGNDTLIGGRGADTALYVANNLPVLLNLSLTTAQDTTEGRDVLIGVENLITGNGNDIQYGNASMNVLTGNGGNDLLAGGLHHDTLSGGMGYDSLNGGYGNDVLDGGYGNDLLQGGAGVDTIIFAGVNDMTVSLETEALQNTGMGIDRLMGIENLTTSSGNDNLTGNIYDNIIISGAGADRLMGRAGNDDLMAGDGNDVLYGGLGNDTLRGSDGLDLLIGGPGADVFSFSRLGPRDRVLDFEDNIDKLRIDVMNPANPGIQITAAADGSGTVVSWLGSSLMLDGISPGDIGLDDMIFF